MLKKIWNNRKTVGYIALALVCVMIGSVIGAGQPAQDVAGGYQALTGISG